MAKNDVASWDTDQTQNGDIAGIGLAEGVMTIASVNNAIRTVMAQIAAAGFITTASTVAVANGGTGLASYTTGDLLYASGATALSKLGIGTAYYVLRSNSGATAPEYAPLTETIAIAISDETTALTTGTAKATFRMPYAFKVTSVKASLTTASSSGLPTFDINEGGTTILSTKLTIDANELTSTTAATAAVISDTVLAADAEMTIDIDTAGTGAKGAKVYILGYRTS